MNFDFGFSFSNSKISTLRVSEISLAEIEIVLEVAFSLFLVLVSSIFWLSLVGLGFPLFLGFSLNSVFLVDLVSLVLLVISLFVVELVVVLVDLVDLVNCSAPATSSTPFSIFPISSPFLCFRSNSTKALASSSDTPSSFIILTIVKSILINSFLR